MASVDIETDIVEVFEASAMHAAQKIVDVILLPEGIEANLHDRSDHAFPAEGQPGAYFISVPVTQEARARELLEEAMKNGFLDPSDGEVIPPRP
jgi:hypothetical protein